MTEVRSQRGAPHLDRRTDTIAFVDTIRVGQALNNLLNSALRHTPTGGCVGLPVDDEDLAAIQVRVTDTGEGIDADQPPHLFDRFYRGDSESGRDTAGQESD